MRVYELMAILSKCSAGAEVEISTLRTVSELANSKTDDGEFYSVTGNINEVADDDNGTVYLNF